MHTQGKSDGPEPNRTNHACKQDLEFGCTVHLGESALIVKQLPRCLVMKNSQWALSTLSLEEPTKALKAVFEKKNSPGMAMYHHSAKRKILDPLRCSAGQHAV